MRVEIRAVAEIDGQMVWVEESDAEMFGVYIGEPGSMGWLADFARHTDAVEWAYDVAESHQCDLKDYVADIEVHYAYPG